MSYLKFQADRIFDGYEFLDSNHMLITDEQGLVVDMILSDGANEDAIRLEGLLTPGLINSHCHLELSHMKDVIPKHTGLVNFLLDVVGKRDFPMDTILSKIEWAEQEMWNEGIVAVGDIGNTSLTMTTKRKSRILWNNFVEVLSISDEKAVDNINRYLAILLEFEESGRQLPSHAFINSLVPHAPYTVSPKAFELINKQTHGKSISIHNQETADEDLLYQKGAGDFWNCWANSDFPLLLSRLQVCLLSDHSSRI